MHILYRCVYLMLYSILSNYQTINLLLRAQSFRFIIPSMINFKSLKQAWLTPRPSRKCPATMSPLFRNCWSPVELIKFSKAVPNLDVSFKIFSRGSTSSLNIWVLSFPRKVANCWYVPGSLLIKLFKPSKKWVQPLANPFKGIAFSAVAIELIFIPMNNRNRESPNMFFIFQRNCWYN